VDLTHWLTTNRKYLSLAFFLTFPTVLLLVLLLRYWPESILYLFLRDLVHQILFYVGGVLAFLEMVLIKWLDTPLEKKMFTTLAILCVFIATFQAWVDEHR
jgi:hypothetical protein